MTADHSSHLGLTVYCWGFQEQSRLIADCLAPAAAKLRPYGLELFWFDRFDARGPHVFAVFTVPSDRISRAQDLLEAWIGEYLIRHPSQEEISPEELAARHDACLGKALCVIHTWPGFAENNSFYFCEHPAEAYPFVLTRSLQRGDQLWPILDDLTGWAAAQLGRSPGASPTGAAVQWLASLSHALAQSCSEPDSYWAYHASTVIPGLRQPAEPLETSKYLTQLIGAQNDHVFGQAWDRARATPLPWPSLPHLLEIVMEAGEPGRTPSGPLLREIVHTTLKQLGIPIRQQRPLLLFAWKHSLAQLRENGVPS